MSIASSSSPGSPPSALELALAKVIAAKEREWQREKALLVAESRTIVAELREQVAGMQARLKEFTEAQAATIAAAVAGLSNGKDGRDGKDVDPVLVEAAIEAAVARAFAANPPKDGKDGVDGKDGTSVGLEEITPVIAEEIARQVAKLPAPPAGKDGVDGKDGAPGPTPTDEQIAGHVAKYLEAHPPPAGADGRDGTDGKDGQRGEKGEDGAPGRDGRDGLPGVPGQPGEKGRDGVDGKDGRDGVDGNDGLGFDDMAVEHDGERQVTLRFARGEAIKETQVTWPVPIYRGIFREGEIYHRGDFVTRAGSVWHCNETTSDKPGDGSKAWTIAVKRGRDGKETVITRPAEPVKITP